MALPAGFGVRVRRSVLRIRCVGPLPGCAGVVRATWGGLRPPPRPAGQAVALALQGVVWGRTVKRAFGPSMHALDVPAIPASADGHPRLPDTGGDRNKLLPSPEPPAVDFLLPIFPTVHTSATACVV